MIAAIVAQVSPLLITIPTVAGNGTVRAVLLQPAAPPALGDPVWADRVTGFPGWLVVNVPIGSGPAGPAGAGWSSGSTVPVGAPANNLVFYLRTSTGDVYQWGGSSWAIIANLKGTPGTNGTNGTNGAAGATGNGWSSGVTVPSVAPANQQIYFHHTTTGDIYTWSGSSWSVTSNIKGTPGGAGPAGTTGPTGSVTSFAGTTAPSGWLLCNGVAVSRTTYVDLYNVIGTTYGVGDGSSTFNVPNMQGRVPVGYNGSDVDFNAVGKLSGAKNPSHTHPLGDAGQAQVYATSLGYVSTRRVASPTWSEALNWTATKTSGTATTQTSGAGLMGATDAATPSALQPAMAFLMIIKT